MVASEDCLSSHQFDAVVLAYVRAVLYGPHEFRFAEAAQIGRNLVFANSVRSFPFFGVQVQFSSTVNRAMISQGLKQWEKLKC
jgi:hypothetical protein